MRPRLFDPGEGDVDGAGPGHVDVLVAFLPGADGRLLAVDALPYPGVLLTVQRVPAAALLIARVHPEVDQRKVDSLALL